MRFRDDEGFTLIEAVVSIAIFAIVATAAAFAIVSSTRAASATDLRVAAGHIADAELDRIVDLGPNVAAAPAMDEVTNDGHTFDVALEATPEYGQPCANGVRDVRVSVTAQGRAQVSVHLDIRLACAQGSDG